MKNIIAYSAAILIIILTVLILPISFIWGLNTLFKLEIPYEFETVLASFVLLTILAPSKDFTKK